MATLLPISAVLLAAGTGSRMHSESGASALLQSDQSKLTLPVGSTTVIGASLRALLDADTFEHIVVVVGHDATAVEAAAREKLHPSDSVSFVRNDCYAAGLSGSIAVGVQALGAAACGIAIGLADLPTLRPNTVRLIASRLRHAPPDAVVRPTYGDQPGHPVLFGPVHHTSLARLESAPDGARGLVNGSEAVTIAVRDPGVVRDVDTPIGYRSLLAAVGNG